MIPTDCANPYSKKYIRCMPEKPLVLVTGAGGRIGRAFVTRNASRFRLRLAEIDDATLDPVRDHATDGALVFDIADAAACAEAVQGCDAVVHLAAKVDPWTTDLHGIARPNLMGVYEVFTAAANEPSVFGRTSRISSTSMAPMRVGF